MGSYGRSFTLNNANVYGINAPASKKGQAGQYTREPGSLGYNEVIKINIVVIRSILNIVFKFTIYLLDL